MEDRLVYGDRSNSLGIIFIVIIALPILPTVDFCWKLILTSFYFTYYYTYFFVDFLRSVYQRPFIRIVPAILLRSWLLIALVSWCISITPIHVLAPTFMDLWSPYVVHEALHTTDVVYDFGDEAAIDIFAIHGLGSNPKSAWSFKTNDTRIDWLQDLLPNVAGFQDSRVVMVNHQTRWDANTAYMELHEHASDILERIESHRKAYPQRPILFIAHSFGGLLLKKTLLLAKQRNHDVATMTKGIVFLGVPHRGTNAAFWASCLSCMAFFRGSSSKLLEFMSVDGTALLDLESEFYDAYVTQYHANEQQPLIYDVLEMRPEKIGKLVVGSIARPKHGLLRHGRVISLDTDHRGLNKFQSMDDPNFQIFIRVLRRTLEHALHSRRSPVSQPPSLSTPKAKLSNALLPTTKTEYTPVHPAKPTQKGEGLSEAAPDVWELALYSMPWTALSVFNSAALSALQELVASWLAKDRNKYGSYLTLRIPKAAFLTGVMGAPLGHFFSWVLRSMFTAYTPRYSKIMRLIVANVIMVPIQLLLESTSQAGIAGAHSLYHFRATARIQFPVQLNLSLSLTLAFLVLGSPTLAPGFFICEYFVVNTYSNAYIKKKRLANLRKKRFGLASEKTSAPE